MDANLGTEIDTTIGYQLAKNSHLSIGYSQLFATETMEFLKGGNKENTTNWAWIMLRFNPQLFSSK